MAGRLGWLSLPSLSSCTAGCVPSALAFGYIWRDSYVLSKFGVSRALFLRSAFSLLTAIVTTTGELLFKRVKRGADFAPRHAAAGGMTMEIKWADFYFVPPRRLIPSAFCCEPGLLLDQIPPIEAPKKVQCYLEQADRERRNAKEMYRIFQQDLLQLKLITGKWKGRTMECVPMWLIFSRFSPVLLSFSFQLDNWPKPRAPTLHL